MKNTATKLSNAFKEEIEKVIKLLDAKKVVINTYAKHRKYKNVDICKNMFLIFLRNTKMKATVSNFIPKSTFCVPISKHDNWEAFPG